MKCIRATNDLRLARKWLQALTVLRIDDGDIIIEAQGDWIDQHGESHFFKGNLPTIKRIGTQWCTLVARASSVLFEARPRWDVNAHGRVQITWDEAE
jgi:hypothetical protein